MSRNFHQQGVENVWLMHSEKQNGTEVGSSSIAVMKETLVTVKHCSSSFAKFVEKNADFNFPALIKSNASVCSCFLKKQNKNVAIFSEPA